MLAAGDSLFGPASDTVEKEEQNRLDMANRFRSQLRTDTFGDASTPATNETAFIGDSKGFEPDTEVGVYAVLWTSADGDRVLSYRGSYSDTDFYNIRLLFGSYMNMKSRERVVESYRDSGVDISDEDENKEGVAEWFTRQAVRFGERKLRGDQHTAMLAHRTSTNSLFRAAQIN